MSRAIPLGEPKSVVIKFSTSEPSRLARWILSAPSSVQYILLADTSRAIPQGLLKPVVIKSSIAEPSRLARWILSAPPSAQFGPMFGGEADGVLVSGVGDEEGVIGVACAACVLSGGGGGEGENESRETEQDYAEVVVV